MSLPLQVLRPLAQGFAAGMLLAVAGCVALSIVVAMIAAPSNLQSEDFKISAPPPASDAPRAG